MKFRARLDQDANSSAATFNQSRLGRLRVRSLSGGSKRARVTSFRHLQTLEVSFAILASVGETDPLGIRKDGLDAFLDQKVEEGYAIETRTDTHAIISRRPTGLKRFTSGPDPGRYVVQVDEDGIAMMRPAEPRRT